jgi:hypothetical protein
METSEIEMSAADVEQFHAAIRKERQEARQAAQLFIDACQSGDVDALSHATHLLNTCTVGGWTFAMRTLARGIQVHRDIPPAFLTVWIQTKSMLSHFDESLVLIKGLRAIFPRYDGPPIKVFRGERFSKSKKGRVGISWTTDKAVAEAFAMDSRRCGEGGSCVIQTTAPAEAIIGSTDAVGDFYNEKEILVDRRKLTRVRIVESFSQILHDEYLASVREDFDAKVSL